MPWITAALVLTNALVYVVCYTHFGRDPDAYELIVLGSNFALAPPRDEPWRLLTALFLHGNLAHLVLNMAALTDLGRQCERLMGSVRFFALYLMSGSAGGIVSISVDPLVNSVGASGAVCGVLGGLFVATRRLSGEAHSRHAAGIGALVLYSAGAAVAGEPVDHVAHFAGLLGGVLCALFLLPPREPARHLSSCAIFAGGFGAFATCAGALYLNAALPAPERVQAWDAERSYAVAAKWFREREPQIRGIERELLRTADRPETKSRLLELASHWEEVRTRFSTQALPPERDEVRRMLAQYAELKAEAYRALAAARPEDGREPAPYKALMQQAKIVEFALRSMLHRI